MKVYLTEEGKKELEAEIAELKKRVPHWDGVYVSEKAKERIEVYEEILSSAVILPDTEIWENTPMYFSIKMVEAFEKEYPNGVIIQPKQ